MNVRASLTLSGTAWTSLMLAAGRITVVNPALCAPNTLNWYFKNTQWKNSFCAKMLRFFQTITLSRTPPTGSTRPCKEISPVIAWIIVKGNGFRFWAITHAIRKSKAQDLKKTNMQFFNKKTDQISSNKPTGEEADQRGGDRDSGTRTILCTNPNQKSFVNMNLWENVLFSDYPFQRWSWRLIR